MATIITSHLGEQEQGEGGRKNGTEVGDGDMEARTGAQLGGGRENEMSDPGNSKEMSKGGKSVIPQCQGTTF